jgi:sugar phosphate isomerase/epimerase
MSLEDRLSLSTCWLSHRHEDGYAMIQEIRELGFQQTELSHGIRMSLVPGIIKAVEEGLIKVSSIHNFCPLPPSVSHAAPNLFQPSAKDRKEIAMWQRYSRKTIEFAVLVGAPKIVMHSGSVQFLFGSPEPALDRDLDEQEPREATKALKKLRRKAGNEIHRVIDAYRSIVPMAAENGLLLGAENREGILELPLDAEWTDFLSHFEEDGPVQYWHDTGHAEIKHRQGLLKHREHFEAIADRLIGFHLHDVSDAGKDHQVPGTGTVDFELIREFLKPEHTLIAELSPRLTTEEVKQSRDYLLGVLC